MKNNVPLFALSTLNDVPKGTQIRILINRAITFILYGLQNNVTLPP